MAKKASAGSGIVWCHDTGSNCVSHITKEPDRESFAEYFASADEDSPGYDPALSALSKQLNELVRQTQAADTSDRVRTDELRVGFLRTGSGFLPVWKRLVGDTERLSDLVDVSTLTDLEAMADERLDEFLHIASTENYSRGGTWKTYTVDPQGIYHCRGFGKACFVSHLKAKVEEGDSAPASRYFPTVEESSSVYDVALNELSAKLNAAVSQTQTTEKADSAKDSRLVIGLVIGETGLLPVWKIVEPDNGEAAVAGA